MTAFLASEAGLVTICLLAAVSGLIVTMVIWRASPRSSLGASDGRAAGTSDEGAVQAALLAAAALIVPLLFSVALPDIFVLPKLTGLRATLIVALVLSGWKALRPRRKWIAARSPRTRAVDFAVIAYAALTTLATVFSINPAHSLVGEKDQYQGLLTTLLYVAFFYLARMSILGARRLSVLFGATVAGATLVAAYAVLQQLGLDPIWSTLDKGRVFSTFGEADWLAAYLVLAMPCGLALIGRAGPVWRAALAVSLILISVGLLLTLSRGGFIGAGIAAIVFALVVGRRSRPTRRWLVVVPALVAVFVIVSAVPSVRSEAEVILSRAASTVDLGEGSIVDRLDLWKVGAAVAVDHPLLGTGPETYPLVFPAYRDRLLASRRDFWLHYRPESPHNVYLAIASGAGFPALFAYLILVFAIARRIVGTIRRVDAPATRLLLAGVLAALCGHLVTDSFMTGEVAGSWLFWLLLGGGVGLADGIATRPVDG